MLREPVFYAGLAVGGLLAWWLAKRRGGLVAGTPYIPRPIRRVGRRGAGWAGGQGNGSYR